MINLVTGAAGFIGFHICNYLLKEGELVIGIDNINPYYSKDLKLARLEILESFFDINKTMLVHHVNIKIHDCYYCFHYNLVTVHRCMQDEVLVKKVK